MGKKGFLDSFSDSFVKWSVSEYSKSTTKNGKPDPYVAAGIAAGMGRFNTTEDRLKLAAILGSQGAFDDDDDDDFDESELDIIEDYDWRMYCVDGSKYDISPYEYDNEEEYERALLEAKTEYTD